VYEVNYYGARCTVLRYQDVSVRFAAAATEPLDCQALREIAARRARLPQRTDGTERRFSVGIVRARHVRLTDGSLGDR